MKRIAALGAVLLVGCGPVVMIPGGRLSGEVEPPPPNWSFTDEVDTVQLETRPADPYSVNVWGVAVGRDFLVAAGDAESRWAQNILADPDVRLRVEGVVYELRALPASDSGVRDAFLAAAKKKYDFEPDPDQESKAQVFRLEPR